MFNIFGKFLSTRRIIGLGLALSAFIAANFPQSSQKTQPSSNAPSTVTSTNVVGMDTAPSPAQPTSYGDVQALNNQASQQPDTTNETQQNQIFRELEFSEGAFNWHRDWWKYLCLAIGSLLVIYFGLRITRMVLRLVIFLSCVAAGFLGALCLGPSFSPWLSTRMPESLTRFMTSQQAGYVLGFLICYLVATVIINFIPHKMQGGPASEKV